MSTIPAMILALAFFGAPLLAGSVPWIHLRISEASGDERLALDVPLSAARSLLPSLRDRDAWRWDRGAEQGLDLRAIVDALREAPDSTILTVQNGDGSARVSRARGDLHIEADDDGARVRIRLPLDVAEALAGDGDGLDVDAALRALERLGRTELLTVESEEASIRIWVD